MLFMAGQGAGADKPVPAAELAVDVISVKGGPRLLGAVLGREENGQLAVAVRREWLAQTHPQLYDASQRDTLVQCEAALQTLRGRIADWRKARPAEGELAAFLKQEADRVEQDLQRLQAGRYQEPAPFLLLDFPQSRAERVVVQTAARRAVALAAWQVPLERVETRTAASLTQELKQRQLAPVTDPDELLLMLPVRPESESAWVARRALVEYQLRKPFDLQGTGDLVFPVGEQAAGAQAGRLIEGVVKNLTGGGLQGLLDQALDPSARPQAAGGGAGGEKWLASASQAAAAADVSGFRVTRVDQNLEAQQVSVETRFVVRFSDGAWRTVWSHTEKGDTTKVRGDLEQQIQQDPQVRQVLEIVKAVGLGGDEQVKLALRFGAATMDCQKQADNRFFRFRDRYLQSLDGPVFPMAPPAKAK
ncbi:MAG: hypothetical protein JSS02_34740 [Planctomycetes bacterium]|nr:hypothetical protein [Planctomycetota bacterium]